MVEGDYQSRLSLNQIFEKRQQQRLFFATKVLDTGSSKRKRELKFNMQMLIDTLGQGQTFCYKYNEKGE